ncbi:MAG: hypothetical protein WBC46_13615 [Nitrospira sp.]
MNVRFASSLAAALLDGLFAHPAGYRYASTAHELIVAYCATIECFRSLLAIGCRDSPSGTFSRLLLPVESIVWSDCHG